MDFPFLDEFYGLDGGPPPSEQFQGLIFTMVSCVKVALIFWVPYSIIHPSSGVRRTVTLTSTTPLTRLVRYITANLTDIISKKRFKCEYIFSMVLITDLVQHLDE